MPQVLGSGKIAQFETIAAPGAGLWLAILASILCIVGLYYHRKAYKPLVEAAEQWAVGARAELDDFTGVLRPLCVLVAGRAAAAGGAGCGPGAAARR